MEPISARPNGDGFIITHRCVLCGHTRNQTASENDNIDKIIELTTNQDFIFGK